MEQILSNSSFDLFTETNTFKPVAHLGICKLSEQKIILLEHTWVDPQKRHQGWAEKLLTAFIQVSEFQEFKILPLCPYAKFFFSQHPEFKHHLINQ
ncbi:N-acetyltransferase [Liquorilactobacillus nagelii]|uniref:N-acetyltransferase n=1 Tax=Liquorilactobacillus nagelii TaxID=82688 RepID=UPI0039EA0A37